MNRIIAMLSCLLAFTSHAQITLMLYPVQGLELKPSDVFRATVQNQDVQTGQFYFVGTITNLTNGEKMVSARSAIVSLTPGATALSEAMLTPTYQVLSSVVSENGVFPYGQYRVCLQVFRVNIIEPVADDCQEAAVTPLSPPLLLSPENQSSITQEYPLLVWLPPMPVMKAPVLYDLKLVEVLPNQTPYDAVQRNFAVLEQHHITGTTLQYPSNAVRLEVGKKYAWKVVATTQDHKPLGETEVWWFTRAVQQEETPGQPVNRNYVEMKPVQGTDFIIVSKELKVQYKDLYTQKHISFAILELNQKVLVKLDDEVSVTGDNRFSIALDRIGKLRNNSFYLLEATGADKSKQYLLFKYIK